MKTKKENLLNAKAHRVAHAIEALKTKHTPGPWKVESYFDANPPYGWPAYRIRGQVLNCSIEPNEDIKNEVKSNARLIAAAVEMLEALKDIAARYVCVGTDENNDTCGVTFTCSPCRQSKAIQTLIAKAEGRE